MRLHYGARSYGIISELNEPTEGSARWVIGVEPVENTCLGIPIEDPLECIAAWDRQRNCARVSPELTHPLAHTQSQRGLSSRSEPRRGCKIKKFLHRPSRAFQKRCWTMGLSVGLHVVRLLTWNPTPARA